MAYTQTEDDIVRDATRDINRAQRTLIRNLRGRLAQIQQEFDFKVEQMFNSDSAAQSALREIHSRLELDCDPEDYAAIVKSIA